MAVLNKIRQRSMVLILVIAMALFAFVIGDLFRNSDALTGSSVDTIATVNGEDINREEFMFKVENLQRRMGPNSTSVQTMNNVYNQELRRIILQTEYDKLGLSVEKDQMRELLQNSFGSYPEFQNQDSIFDVNRMNAFIANLKEIAPQPAPLSTFQINYQQWNENEQAIAAGALQNDYFNLIKAGLGATVAEAQDEYVADAKKVDVRYVQVPFTSIADSLVEVSKSEIKAYMEKNKEKYQVDATREIIYVQFDEVASPEDETIMKDNLLTLKNDRVEFVSAERPNDTIKGFDNTDNIEAFVNANSDLKYNDVFLRGGELPAAHKDSILGTNVGGYYGPYNDNGFYKLSKVLEKETRPDSVKVRHILIPYAGATRVDPTITITAEEAKATADSIFNVASRNRSKFQDLLELSSDKVSNENDGIIEFAYNQSFAPEFKSYSFDNKIGDMDVVETSFGYHVIEILDQTGLNPTVKLATIADKIEPSEETINDVYNAVGKFEIALENGDFRTIAEEKGLSVRPATFKELDENIPGLGSQRQVVRWSFEDDTELNDYKRFPIAGRGFIIAQLVDINEEGLMDVDNATTPVLAEVRKEKKAKMIMDKISATSVDDIASAQGQSVKTASGLTLKNTTLSGAGAEPKIVGAAFGLKEGETSKPIVGDRGVYVLEVTKVTDAPALDNYTAVKNRLSTARRNTVQSKVFTALQEAADIDDNRAKTVY
ncbi:SurA N-terminal domain-containing protein [Winogradskyella maritima]|uniref:Periplasmic chaperone PpiD n=1 Tax=Winogradskyella maritima TaxID=1517766 RepID=A0ABV8AFQ6_9FLAO|nr:SurA N-terminal domain-containing protein [Winogradskyella maritima]